MRVLSVLSRSDLRFNSPSAGTDTLEKTFRFWRALVAAMLAAEL
jgi:hypothetical protein